MINRYLEIYSYTTRPVVSSLQGLLDHGLPKPLAEFFASRKIWDKTDQSNVLEALKGIYAIQENDFLRSETRGEGFTLARQWMVGVRQAAEALSQKGYWVSDFSELNRGKKFSALLEETDFAQAPAPLYFRMLRDEKVSTDAELLEQVVHELQINRAHSGAQARSVIVARAVADQGRKGIEILALDNGAGIPSVLWAVEPGNSITGETARGKGLSYILSAVRSEPNSFVEIHTARSSGDREAYRFLSGRLEPEAIEPVLQEQGTLVRIVRFAFDGRSEVRNKKDEDSYKDQQDFLDRYTLKKDDRAYKLRDIIARETPSAAYALSRILELRRLMDKAGQQDRPVVIWQNLSLGQYFPYFNKTAKSNLRALELSEDSSQWSSQLAGLQVGQTRFILIKQKTASSFPGENKDYASYEEEAWDPSVDMWGAKEAKRIAQTLKAPLVMVDHSRKGFSNAQQLWADQARREGAVPHWIREGSESEFGMVLKASKNESPLFLLNANVHPERQGSFFDDNEDFLKLKEARQALVGDRKIDVHEVFLDAYAEAVLENVLGDDARPTPKDNVLSRENKKTPQKPTIDQSSRSEVRSDTEKTEPAQGVQSEARAENQSVRTAIENLRGKFTIMTDLADVAQFTDAQLQEFETMAILQPNVKLIFYGSQDQPFSVNAAIDRLKQLQRQLGAGRVAITDKEPEDLQVVKDEKIIRIFKGDRTFGLKARKLYEFRYVAEETGLVPVALLYADQHEKPSEKGAMDLSMVSAMLRVALQEFQNSIVFARAA
jgi:hypothetical protein